MSSIRYFVESFFYKSLFNFRLNKSIRNYKGKVIESFDLYNSMDSYWIECNKEYVCSPQIVEDNKDLYAPFKKQTKTIMKNWQHFPSSAQKDLSGLLNYVVWLKKTHLNKKQDIMFQKRVSDHIYEM